MNIVDLRLLKEMEEEFLKRHNLDIETREEFKNKIDEVTEEEKRNLGEQLFNLVAKKGYVEERDLKEVMKLVFKGADIEYHDEKKGDYILLICARKNYFKTFLFLLRCNANVNQVNNYLTTPLMASARHGNVDMVKLLILLGAEVNARCLDGDTALISAKRHNQNECFNILLNANAYINYRNLKGESVDDITGNIKKNNPEEEKKEVTHEDALQLIRKAKKDLQDLSSRG